MDYRTELDDIRAIINKREDLTNRDRAKLQTLIAHSILADDDKTFIELCNFVSSASKKALKIRFNF